MSVDFQPGDQIVHKNSHTIYTYLGVKGYGGSRQYIYKETGGIDQLYHFVLSDVENWKKFVPGLQVGKTYRFKDSTFGNVYKVLWEYTHPDTGTRVWYTEVTHKTGMVGAMSPYPLHQNHVERLEEVTTDNEW